MKLIIEIPEEVYKKQRYSQYFGAWSVVLQKCFENGIPLTDVLKKIEADIFNACSDKYHVPINKLYCVEIFEIIEKYRESED